jgi:hypothetical protein
MATTPTNVKRKYLGDLQRGVVQRDTDVYPTANAAFFTAIKSQQIEIRDRTTGVVLQAALVAGNLEEEIIYTGQNVSDAPSNNPSLMSITPIYIGNGEWRAQVTYRAAEGNRSVRICYNSMMPYLSASEIEGRTFACGEEHLFQGYWMTGQGDDGQRSDSTPNAHQLITVM